jgi:cytochrome c oxidase cbb3-type subunit IV
MKFASYLETITGVGIFPLISLLVFVLFFTAVAVWALRADKSLIIEIKNLPLEPTGEDDAAEQKNNKHV